MREGRWQQPRYPAAAFAERLRPLVAEAGLPAVADLARIHDRRLYAIMVGEQRTIGEDLADRIAVYVLNDPSFLHVLQTEEGFACGG